MPRKDPKRGGIARNSVLKCLFDHLWQRVFHCKTKLKLVIVTNPIMWCHPGFGFQETKDEGGGNLEKCGEAFPSDVNDGGADIRCDRSQTGNTGKSSFVNFLKEISECWNLVNRAMLGVWRHFDEMFCVKSCHCLCSNSVPTTSYCHMDILLLWADLFWMFETARLELTKRTTHIEFLLPMLLF